MSDIRLCPHCGIGLQATQLLEENPIDVDVCPACRGIWFDTGELKSVLKAATDPDAVVNRHLLTTLAERTHIPDSITYVKCPACESIMNRSCYGHRSGVIVDQCRQHGIWLDGGELERLFGWVSAGGHVLNEQVEAEKADRQKRRDEERRRAIAQMDRGDVHIGVGGYRVGHHRSGMGGALGDLIASLFYR